MSPSFQPAWADVSLSAIESNFKHIQARCRVPVLAAVKSDAYGHGAVTVARLLSELGVAYLGVANLGEALELRRAGIETPILILGYTPPDARDVLCAHRLTQTIVSLEMAEAFASGASGPPLRVHLKVDTGMSRLGFVWQGEETLETLARAARLPGLEVEGVFTHLPASDGPGDAQTTAQIETFRSICAGLVDRIHKKIELCHCANSGAVIHYEKAAMDMVRTGLLLYGLPPDPAVPPDFPIMPAMRLCAAVSQVKTVGPGASVSYGRTWTADNPCVLATISAGYADGYPRLLSSRASVLIRGQRAPVVGRVCMDMLMADITDISGVRVGDAVTLFGPSPEGPSISADELALLTGTISYELLCGVGRRVPRIYWRNGGQVGCVNHLMAGERKKDV